MIQPKRRPAKASHLLTRGLTTIVHSTPLTLALLVSTSLITLSVVAAFSDLRAFQTLISSNSVIAIAAFSLSVATYLLIMRDRNLRPIPLWFTVIAVIGIASPLTAIPRLVTIYSQTPALEAAAAAKGGPLDWSGRSVSNTNFENANLQDANLSSSHLTNVDFGNANLSGADLRNASLNQVNLGGANLCGADLRGADLKEALNLDQVANWNYTFYNSKTLFPTSFNIAIQPGPELDIGYGLLFMCTPGNTQILQPYTIS